MITKQPLVSYIIAAYNEEKYIIECIESCLNQTYKNIEICITDDGSIDNTLKILISRYQSNTRVKLGRFTKNRGKVAAFNNSFRMSKGKYIAIMGADDVCLHDRVKDSIKNIGKYDLIFGNLASFDENGIISNNVMREYFGIAGDQEITFIQLIKKPIVYGGTIFAKRNILEYIFPLDEKMDHEDWWIPLSAAYKKNIKFLDRLVGKYRISSKQSSGNNGLRGSNFNKWRKLKYREIPYYQKILNEFELPISLKNEIKGKLFECMIYKSNKFKKRLFYFKFRLMFSTKKGVFQKIKIFISVINLKLFFYLSKIKNILIRSN